MASFEEFFDFDRHDLEFDEMLLELKKVDYHTPLKAIDQCPTIQSEVGSYSPIEKVNSVHKGSVRKRRSSKNIMEVCNVTIELSDNDSSEDSEECDDDNSEVDLNATISLKIGHRRYTKMLETLDEIELGGDVTDRLEKFMSDLNIGAKAYNMSDKITKNRHQRIDMPCKTNNGHHKSKKRFK